MTTAAEPTTIETRGWKPMVAAIGKTAGASIAGGLFSALATKLIAALLGPGAFALLQTLQQLRDGALIAATANGRTALVQGASALEGIERREFLRTASLLFVCGTFVVAAAMLLAPSEIAQWSRLPEASARLVPYLGGTVALLSLFVFLGAILNAFQEFGKLALLQIVAPLSAAIAAWPVAILVRAGFPLAMILFLAIPAATGALAAALVQRTHRDQLVQWFAGPGRWWTFSAARGFLSISGAMLISGLVSTAVLLAVRGSITRREGIAMTGQFDAAWNISMTQVTLILGSVQTYYLPSLAAAKSAKERTRQIRGMLLLATLTTVPAIIALTALKPLAVTILYSHAFASSPSFLRWTLLGDYLKVSSWVLAAPMLATRDVGAFLALDLATYTAFFVSSMLLARLASASEGAAMGFALSYALYLALSYVWLRLRHGFRAGVTVCSIWLTGLALIIGASGHFWRETAIHAPKAASWILAAVCFSAASAVFLRKRVAL